MITADRTIRLSEQVRDGQGAGGFVFLRPFQFDDLVFYINIHEVATMFFNGLGDGCHQECGICIVHGIILFYRHAIDGLCFKFAMRAYGEPENNLRQE